MIFFKAFLVGGLICAIGQILIDRTNLTPAKILVSFVVAGVILGGLGVYDPIVDWAGAGAYSPYRVWKPARSSTKEAVAEDGLSGVLTGPLSAGAAGITAAMIGGLAVSFVTKPKDK